MPDLLTRLQAALADRYHLQRELGAGGMATVFLAHDARHDRQVALKVLRQELAAVIGADRFLAEIRTTANLQHPHILPLFESGAADGFLYYVMPYVEGEALRDRLRREKQLPVEEAVRIAREVASALDYAHRHGVIHRDIKPENIMLHDGSALVADFGIALAVSTAGDNRMTETGMSLGTPYYMSPEQAMGERAITARSDVYALGAVLYEMLTGEPPFTGPTAQAIVARVLTETPRPLAPQRHTIPPHVEAATLRALEKLPADRFAGPAQFSDALAGGSTPMLSSARLVRRRLSPTSNWQIAAAAVVGAVLGALAFTPLLVHRPPVAGSALRHFQLILPDSAPLDFFAPSYYGEGRPALAITPDGSTLIYVARIRDHTTLYLRHLDRDEFTPIPGTEGAADPFVSPDGTWLAFIAGGELRKVPLGGGPVSVVAPVSEPQGMTWLTDGRILDHRRWVVPSSGGEWKPAGPGIREFPRGWPSYPSALPNNQWVVLSVGGELRLASLRDSAQLTLSNEGLVAPDSALRSISGASPRYVRSGHLVYVSGGTLTALPFNPQQLQVLGPAVAMVSGVRQEALEAAQTAIGEDGTLVYAKGAHAGRSFVVWADTTGRIIDTLPIPRGEHFDIWSSPNGRWVLVHTRTSTGAVELVLLDVSRGLVRPFHIPDPDVDITTWWPNGERIVGVSKARSLAYPIEGAIPPDTLMGRMWTVLSVSPKMDYMVGYYPQRGPHGADSAGMWLVPLRGGPWTRVRPFGYGWANFSPDGQWLAYLGDEGLYVTRVPANGSALQVSPKGADEPEWSPRGDALYYRMGDRWMTIPISTKLGLLAGKPRVLFRGRYLQVVGKSYDVSREGHFLLLAGPQEETTNHLEVVTGFFGELQRRAAEAQH